MARGYRVLVFVLLMVAGRAHACEPVVPFIQVVAPALALSGSLLVLAMAVAVKSALFAAFERRLPRLRAAWRMFLGNVLTSLVGLLTAAMIASGAAWFIGVPLVYVLCWLPSQRLVKVAPLAWLARTSRAGLAAIMTSALLASCILFATGQGAIQSHQLMLYWIIKLLAIFLALLASVTLTTVWEEWVIWRSQFAPGGDRLLRICAPYEPLCPCAGHGRSRCRPASQEAEVPRLSRQTRKRAGCPNNRPISLATMPRIRFSTDRDHPRKSLRIRVSH